MPEVIKDLAARLSSAGRPSSDYDLNPEITLPDGRRLRDAAVLVPLIATPQGISVMLTMRSSALKHHPGQIAFPGGKLDPGDADAVDAALREAHEEIGLPRDSVDVIATLPAHETVTGFMVTPIVGHVRDRFEIIPEPGEVEEVFEVPLEFLLNPANFRIESRRWRGQRRYYYTVPYGPYYIWGATARMLKAFADAAGEA